MFEILNILLNKHSNKSFNTLRVELTVDNPNKWKCESKFTNNGIMYHYEKKEKQNKK